MKKVILSILCAISATVTMAQTNPKSGYVITNSGDTIRGIIDLRTNERLSKQCKFWANGEKEGKTYKPGDIESFRFEDGGKFFVSRRLNVTGTPELYFAEFMVQGKMNLYCVVYRKNEYFFFEREDGEMAALTNRDLTYTTNNAIEMSKGNIQEKREQYGKVKMLLQQSMQAVEGLDDNNISRKKLVKVVRDYHNDVCTDGSTCIVYEYKEKSDKIKAHFKAFASYAYYATEMVDMNTFMGVGDYTVENYPGSTYEIGIGTEIELERVMKGFSVECEMAFTPKYKSTRDVEEYPSSPYFNTIKYTYEKSILTFSLGAVKSFGQGKIQPIVHGGGFAVIHFRPKETKTISYKVDRAPTKDEKNWCNSAHYGIYLGAGAQMPLGKHYVRLHADWYKSLEPKSMGQMTKWGITAEFIL